MDLKSAVAAVSGITCTECTESNASKAPTATTAITATTTPSETRATTATTATTASASETDSASDSADSEPKPERVVSNHLPSAVAKIRDQLSKVRRTGKTPSVKPRLKTTSNQAQSAIIGFWKQNNLSLNNFVIRNYWTRVAGFPIELLDAIWDDVPDMMDTD